MTDYIDRQAAIDALDVLCQEHRYRIPGKVETYSQYNEAWQDALDRAEGVIGNMPSTDIQDQIDNAYMHGYTAAEARYRDALRHGHWVASDEDGFVCSVCRCGYKNQPTLMGKPMFEHCPVCGARMDGEEDDKK